MIAETPFLPKGDYLDDCQSVDVTIVATPRGELRPLPDFSYSDSDLGGVRNICYDATSRILYFEKGGPRFSFQPGFIPAGDYRQSMRKIEIFLFAMLLDSQTGEYVKSRMSCYTNRCAELTVNIVNSQGRLARTAC